MPLTDQPCVLRAILDVMKDLNLRQRRATASLISACHRGEFRSEEFTVDEALHFARIPPTTDLGSGVRMHS